MVRIFFDLIRTTMIGELSVMSLFDPSGSGSLGVGSCPLLVDISVYLVHYRARSTVTVWQHFESKNRSFAVSNLLKLKGIWCFALVLENQWIKKCIFSCYVLFQSFWCFDTVVLCVISFTCTNVMSLGNTWKRNAPEILESGSNSIWDFLFVREIFICISRIHFYK